MIPIWSVFQKPLFGSFSAHPTIYFLNLKILWLF